MKKIFKSLLILNSCLLNVLLVKPLTVKGAGDPTTSNSVYYGGINFDCGSEATVCPNNLSSAGTLNETDSFKSKVGEKPIPVRPGYEFVDWEITSVHPQTQYNGTFLKAGDCMTDWNSYIAGNVWNHNPASTVTWEYYSLDLKAVWEPLPTETSKVPINLSISSTPINVTLPSEILLAFSPNDTEAVIANDLSIINESTIGVLNVTQIKARSKTDSWKLVKEDSASYFSTLPFDSHELYLGFSVDGTKYTPLMDPLIDPQIKIDPKGAGTNRKGFKLRGMSGGSSVQISTDLIEIEFTFGYEMAETDKGMSKEEAAALGYTLFELSDGSYEIGNKTISGDVVIPNCIDGAPVTQISALGFEGNDKITSVKIPDSVTTISSQAFMNCTGLTTIQLPKTVAAIPYGAFQGCENLSSILIPSSVRMIDSEAFAGCASLTAVNFEEGSQCTRIGDYAFAESGIRSLVLPEGLKVIEMASFGDCSQLSGKVTIPRSVTAIEALAFAECGSLDELFVPKTVISIEEDAFANVPHITYSGSAEGAPWGALSMN